MARINIEYDDREVASALRRVINAGGDLTPAMRSIAAALEDSVAEAFASEKSPSGVPWADLSDTTKSAREKRGKWPGETLQVTGNLADSIESRYDADEAVVGTNVVYAATHQFGAARGAFGTSYGNNALGTPIPWGDIPARPFLGLNTEAETTILEFLKRHFEVR